MLDGQVNRCKCTTPHRVLNHSRQGRNAEHSVHHPQNGNSANTSAQRHTDLRIHIAAAAAEPGPYCQSHASQSQDTRQWKEKSVEALHNMHLGGIFKGNIERQTGRGGK